MKKTLLAVLALCMVGLPLIYAQDDGKNLIYALDDFSGGIASKISPFALNKKQATIAENVRLNSRYRSISKRNKLNTYGTADPTARWIDAPVLGPSRRS